MSSTAEDALTHASLPQMPVATSTHSPVGNCAFHIETAPEQSVDPNCAANRKSPSAGAADSSASRTAGAEARGEARGAVVTKQARREVDLRKSLAVFFIPPTM
jgi:hypothetical protein